MKTSVFAVFIALSALLLAACSPAAPTTAPIAEATQTPAQPAAELVLATTTSTQDSGLLDYLLPLFEQEANVKVKVVAVGSGQALQMGVDGDADVLLVHSPAGEKMFMEAGDGVRREDVMYNDFVIVGPETDPAGISGMKSAGDAFQAIAASGAAFISRGDDSGTHSKEKAVWASLNVEPQGDWYVSAGQGMGAVLTMADEKLGYTLSDRATYLTQTQKGLKLKIMVEGDKLLLNPYGVIAVNPEKNARIQAELANRFIDWMISLPVQEKIADFKKADFGVSLFTPDSSAWRAAHSQ